MFPFTPGMFRKGEEETTDSNAQPVFTPFQSAIRNNENSINASSALGSTAGLNSNATNQNMDELYAYGMDASVLRVAPQMINVSVRCAWDDHVLQLRNIEIDMKTIRDLKEAVAANLRHETGQNWTANDLQFVYEGRILNSEWHVCDCDIRNDPILHASAVTNIANIDNTTVYTVPTPGVGNYDGNAVHSNMADEMVHEFNLNDPHGYERMRAEELLEFNMRPQQRYFQNLLVNFDGLKENETLRQEAAASSSSPGEAPQEAEDEFLMLQQLVSSYHDVCHELKVGRFGGDQAAVDTERKEWISSEEEVWLYLMKLSELCYEEYAYEANSASQNKHNMGITYDDTSQIAIRRLLDFKLSRDDKEMDICRKFRRINMIVQWFEQVAVDGVEYLEADLDSMGGDQHDAKAPWPDTIYEAVESKSRGRFTSQFASELDPDGPTRSNMSICPDDELRQKVLLQGVWTLLRAGRIDAAQRLCESQGEAWRAASLAGGQEDIEYAKDDEDEDTHGVLNKYIPEGNAYRALWKLTCWKLSEVSNKTRNDKTKSGGNQNDYALGGKVHLSSSFEEAIYAALAGNLNALLNSVHCNTWKDQFWAYVLCMKERMRDEALYNAKSMMLQNTKFVNGNANVKYEKVILDKSINVKSILESDNPADAIFNKLQQNENSNIRNDTGKVTTIIQGRLIANDFKDIIENRILKFVDESQNEMSTYRPDVLRFGTHLVLWLRAVQNTVALRDRVMPPGTNPDVASENRILCAYIDYLVERRQLSSIALYVSHLQPELATARYAKFLEIVVDESERHVCVDLGNRHFMGAPEVLFDSLVRCVEATRARYDEIIPGMRSRLESIIKTSLGLNPYEISLQQFSRAWCIRWLCFHDEHRLEAMHQANMLCRDLIMEQQQKDDEIYIIMSLLLLPVQKQRQVGGSEKDVHHQYLPIIPLIVSI